MLRRIKAVADSASLANREFFGRIVALVEGCRRGSAAYVLPPTVCALLFLRMSPERDPGTRPLGVRSGSIVEFAARMASGGPGWCYFQRLDSACSITRRRAGESAGGHLFGLLRPSTS
jgi:hypothetical protein